VRSPLVSLPALRDPRLAASLVMNILVSSVMMATLVVGPFFLAIGLGLSVTAVGLVLAVGPLVSTLSGIPAGRIVDRFGAGAIVAAGLLQMMVGALALAFAPVAFGLPGYVVAIALLTPGYQLFQAANNTAVMMDVDAGRRGVISGLLSLSRNLGLITGAALMGAIFARVSGPLDTADAAQAAGFGLTVTFCIAAALALLALLVAFASGIAARAKRPTASTGAGG
jgi:MFS family permease